MSGTGLLEAGVSSAANGPNNRAVVHLSCCSTCTAAHHRLCCTRCYCTTGFLVCRSSFTHCSWPKCSNCSCPSHPLISITRCSQAKFDTCQELTSRLHASQWKRRCRRLGRLMSRDVDDRPSTDASCSHCRPTECWMPRQMFLCFGMYNEVKMCSGGSEICARAPLALSLYAGTVLEHG